MAPAAGSEADAASADSNSPAVSGVRGSSPKRSASPKAKEEQAEQQPQAKDVPRNQLPPQQQQPDKPSIRSYFRWRPLPWYVFLIFAIFSLTKLQLVYNDSPCAVLGTQSPVSSADVKRAFRTLSMCTHPDRLRGRLGRSPTKTEERRGEIIFNRASVAKEELMKVLKGSGKKKVMCYQGELELAVLAVFASVGKSFAGLGLNDYFMFAYEFVYSIVTFQSGFLNTILSLFWFAFMYRMFKQLFMYLWRMGVLRGTLAIVTTVVIGPIPTVVHFFFLPVLRLVEFLKTLVQKDKVEVADAAPAEEVPAAEAVPETPMPTASSAGMAVATEGNNRQSLALKRKKKESDDVKEKRKQALLQGESPPAEGGHANCGHPQLTGPPPMPESIFKLVAWTHKEQVRARQAAAAAVQFDLLLILTKPVIPLCMLLATGQVWSGLISSMVIGHLLRRWVPQMSYEAHHLLVAIFGMMHTLLGVSASQVEDYANREGRKILHLAWSWSLKDVLSVVHMCQLGAVVTACSALGNEPSFSASFASGIAMRMLLAQDSVAGLDVTRTAAQWIDRSTKDLGISLDSAEEVVAYGGGGIGDCAGGPFRMLLGDDQKAYWTANILKGWLMLLPLLATLQWGQRTYYASRNLGKKWKTTRFVQRLILFVLGVVQCILIWNVELNASNGALGNFWIAMLFGCAGESLMSTYDIRGPVRQVVFLAIFIFI